MGFFEVFEGILLVLLLHSLTNGGINATEIDTGICVVGESVRLDPLLVFNGQLVVVLKMFSCLKVLTYNR